VLEKEVLGEVVGVETNENDTLFDCDDDWVLSDERVSVNVDVEGSVPVGDGVQV
jgi:hypothetical protein